MSELFHTLCVRARVCVNRDDSYVEARRRFGIKLHVYVWLCKGVRALRGYFGPL